MTLWSATILGEPASKSNSRKLVTSKKTGKAMFIKSDKARGWQFDASRQLIAKRPQFAFDKPLRMDCTIYYASHRPDLDESLVMDVLQFACIIKNDRLIREKHVFHAIDKANPRVEISLSERA